MFKKTFLRPFALGLTLTGMTVTVLAQSAGGGIRGTVLDPSGALIPHAQITISNAAGFSRTIQSGATGAFEASRLRPGNYSVSVNAPGFTPALEGSIEVSADQVTQENVKLGISVNQEIEVSATDTGAVSTQADTSDESAGNR